MRKLTVYIFITAAVFYVSYGYAAYGEETLTWIECVKEARENHPDLVSAEEKIREAEASRDITVSAYLPRINASASGESEKGSVFGGGGNTGIVPGGDRRGNTSGKWQNTYMYDIEGQQLLFDGFKTSYDISAAGRNITSLIYNYDVISSDIRLRLRTAYVNLLSAQEFVSVAEEIKERRRRNLELVELRYEGGREHRGALLTAEADLAQADLDVTQSKRSIELAARQITKELGRQVFTPMTAEGDFSVSEPERKEPDFEYLSDSNPFIRQLVALKEAAKFGVRSAKAAFFPSIYATGSGGKTGTAMPPENTDWALGVRLSFPIFEGGSRIAGVSKARAALGRAGADERSGKDGVIYTMAAAWINLQDAVDNVGVRLKFLEATKERARISEAEYSIGLLSFDNWIIIEDNLVSAEKNYISARRDALIAEAQWIQAKGGTLYYDQEK
ncbi:MAG: TolC family protein [Candidatus Omnitrophota bacterium]